MTFLRKYWLSLLALGAAVFAIWWFFVRKKTTLTIIDIPIITGSAGSDSITGENESDRIYDRPPGGILGGLSDAIAGYDHS